MSFSLNAWAGDNAGSIVGRQFSRALVAVTYTEDDLPLALFSKGDLDGTSWYWQIDVECLTPNARTAMVTKVEDAGANVFSLEITPWKFPEDGKVDWEPGVHLFSITISGDDYTAGQSGTIATVIIPPKLKVKSFSPKVIQKMLAMRQSTRRRHTA